MGLHRILRRYREVGASATADYLRRRLNNRIIGVLNRLGPERLGCPCCGWRGTRFLDFAGHGYGLANYLCPGCGSHPRHRGLYLYLREMVPRLGPGGAVLHLAPEPAVARLFAGLSEVVYVTADLSMKAAAIHASVDSMPFRDGAFSLVVCSHILEHLKDDAAALREISRLVAPGGQALVLVPTRERWESQPTDEFSAPDPQLDGHWRSYGCDLVGRIERAGFRCRPVRFSEFISAETRAASRIDEDTIFVALKPALARGESPLARP